MGHGAWGMGHGLAGVGPRATLPIYLLRDTVMSTVMPTAPAMRSNSSRLLGTVPASKAATASLDVAQRLASSSGRRPCCLTASRTAHAMSWRARLSTSSANALDCAGAH